MKISNEMLWNSVEYRTNDTYDTDKNTVQVTERKRDSVQISQAGYREWKESIQNSNMFCQAEDSPSVELDATGTDVWSQQLRPYISNALRNIREKGGAYGFTDIMNASLQAYAALYEEIEQGYAEGNREIWVADEKEGKRLLSKEEEQQRLANAYQREIEWNTMLMNSRKETQYVKSLSLNLPVTKEAKGEKESDEKELSQMMMKMQKNYLAQRAGNNGKAAVENAVVSAFSSSDFLLRMQSLFAGISEGIVYVK